MRAAPDLALPRVRLGQIAMVRGQYAAAADRLREAETAQPGWILNAPDIQALYGEPTDFANNVAELESYLQANPDDRDAWLVLGAEWFLSGRTNKAADVFKRLNDPNRKPDVALAAFLDASNQAGLKRREAARRRRSASSLIRWSCRDAIADPLIVAAISGFDHFLCTEIACPDRTLLRRRLPDRSALSSRPRRDPGTGWAPAGHD